VRMIGTDEISNGNSFRIANGDLLIMATLKYMPIRSYLVVTS
jgi:hypothetical protein